MSKIKMLAWGDYCCATGFATVIGNIMRELYATDKYDLDVVAINYSGDPYNQEKWPGHVYPAMPGAMMQAGPYGDVYGRQRLLDQMGTGMYDVVFMLQDTFVLEPIMEQITKTQELLASQGKKTFKTVYYFPIDATPKAEWAEIASMADYPVVYTEYGKRELLKLKPELEHRLKVIYHGNNPEDFFPIQDKQDVKNFRHQYFNGKADDRFLIVNVNRNQPRKDIARSLMVLKELYRRGRNPVMYLHMQYQDTGGNIFAIAKQLGLGEKQEFLMPSANIFNANQGMPIEDVNRIYNAADVVFSTTLGEGWGLSATEAMATKTPIAFPDNTSLTEMLANNRGRLIPSGSTSSEWIVKEMDNERIRPLTNVTAAADALEEIMDGKLPNIEAAYQWVQNLNWKNIVKEWIDIIDIAAEDSRRTNERIKKRGPQKPPPEFMSRAQRRQLERESRKAQP